MQKIRDLLKAKANDNWGQGPLTFAFLGDSVTQTCFELYKKSDGAIDAYYDADAAYHLYLKRMLAMLYPSVPVNILNAGIGGDNASPRSGGGMLRPERFLGRSGRSFRIRGRAGPDLRPSQGSGD